MPRFWGGAEVLGSQAREDGRHELAIAGLHLAVLWAFAVAQPLL